MVSYGHTAADADKNCIGLHGPAIPFPTYQKMLSVCFLKLRNAQRRYLTTKPCSSSRRFRRTTGRRRLRFRRVPPLLHRFYTSCTRQPTSIDGGLEANHPLAACQISQIRKSPVGHRLVNVVRLHVVSGLVVASSHR